LTETKAICPKLRSHCSQVTGIIRNYRTHWKRTWLGSTRVKLKA